MDQIDLDDEAKREADKMIEEMPDSDAEICAEYLDEVMAGDPDAIEAALAFLDETETGDPDP